MDLQRASSASMLALVPAGDVEQAIAAFQADVDQYQAGPVSDGEAVARAIALLRRRAWPTLKPGPGDPVHDPNTFQIGS